MHVYVQPYPNSPPSQLHLNPQTTNSAHPEHEATKSIRGRPSVSRRRETRARRGPLTSLT